MLTAVEVKKYQEQKQILKKQLESLTDGLKNNYIPESRIAMTRKRIRELADCLETIEVELQRHQTICDRAIASCTVGARFRTRTFENYVHRAQPDAFKVAAAFAENFSSNDGTGLLLSGSVGTGKTHLAAAIANYLAPQGYFIKFGTFENILNEMRKSYDNPDIDSINISEKLQKVHLLIIDDLGKEYLTDWGKSILYSVINGRYENNMPVVITTNEKPAFLKSRYGDAIISRLVETTFAVHMYGEDFRYKRGL